MRLLLGILLLTLAQTGVFYQFFAPIKYAVLKTNWWVYLIALPIVWAFMNGTRICAEELGEMWGVKIITSVSGIITFTILNYLIFDESLTLKTTICLSMAISIIAIQILWK